MQQRRKSLALAVLAAAAVAAGAVMAAGPSGRGAPRATAPTKAEGEMPAALANHLAKLRQSIPGNGGEPGESASGERSSAGLQAFIELAYPKKDVPLSSIRAARASFYAAENRSPNHPHLRWEQVGPEIATYQRTPLRTAADYVPNEYAAGGRTTDLVVDPRCGQHGRRCRMWITPAGGGVWRTEDALANNVRWRYLSGSFGINSIGSITIDPNDSSGNTLWVGTGEGNTCGSGCVAGVGLYKSTDGGDHWSGPMGAVRVRRPRRRHDRDQAGQPERRSSPARPFARSRACVVVLLRRHQPVPGTDPGRAALGALPLHERRNHVDARPQRLDVPADVRRRTSSRSRTTPLRARRVASGGCVSTRAIRTSSTRRPMPAASGARATAATTWTQIKPSLQRDQRDDPARHRRHAAPERQDAHVRRRGVAGPTGESVQPALPERRRRDRRAGRSRT